MLKKAVVLSLSLTSLLILNKFTVGQVRPRQSSSQASGQRSVNAGDFPGADLGAKINAADRALGAAAGEIVVRGGGVISTGVIVSTGHTLRLYPGTYAPNTSGIPILLKSGAAIVGSGWDDTIILESTAKDQFTVVSAFNHAQSNGGVDSDITIRDVQIKGANSGFNSAPQAVSLGNCHRCTVERVWLDGTRSIGIQLGGSAHTGNYARNSKIINNLLTRVASQAIACVNCEDVEISGNRVMRPGLPGGPGCTSIDLEMNAADDRMVRVKVTNNLIDHRFSEVITTATGNGIVVNGGDSAHIEAVEVSGNEIIGGGFEEIQGMGRTLTNRLSNGIYVFGPKLSNVTVRDNRITRTGQSGIHIEGARLTVLNNQMTDVGGGGTPGFYVIAVTDSRVVGNVFKYTGVGPADSRILIEGATSRNVFSNNSGFTMFGQSQ